MYFSPYPKGLPKASKTTTCTSVRESPLIPVKLSVVSPTTKIKPNPKIEYSRKSRECPKKNHNPWKTKPKNSVKCFKKSDIKKQPKSGKALKLKTNKKNKSTNLSSSNVSLPWPLAFHSKNMAGPLVGIPKIRFTLLMSVCLAFMLRLNTIKMSTLFAIWAVAVALLSESLKKPDFFM